MEISLSWLVKRIWKFGSPWKRTTIKYIFYSIIWINIFVKHFFKYFKFMKTKKFFMSFQNHFSCLSNYFFKIFNFSWCPFFVCLFVCLFKGECKQFKTDRSRPKTGPTFLWRLQFCSFWKIWYLLRCCIWKWKTGKYNFANYFTIKLFKSSMFKFDFDCLKSCFWFLGYGI